MKLIKNEHEFGTNVTLNEEDKYLSFNFCGNLDLYWSINYKEDKDNYDPLYFTITKENYNLFLLFKELFYDIENINISNNKDNYRIRNYSNYNELYNKDNKTITWYSDETAHAVANILRIRDLNDRFELEFIVQPYINGYDEDFHYPFYIPIRFRNSGSRYDPFNSVFMKMYHNTIKLEDSYDFGHQIHIEEYLYEEQKKLLKTKRTI